MKTPKFIHEDSYNKSIVTDGEPSALRPLIPEWQKKLGKEELKNIASGNTELLEWVDTRKLFNL
jgi:hypothetical protein